MGIFSSKESDNNEDTMDDERESLPCPCQDTASGEDEESAVESQGNSHNEDEDEGHSDPDLSDTSAVTVHVLTDSLRADFSDALEPFFAEAENYIQRDNFDLTYAKRFLDILRDVSQRYMDRGYEEDGLEHIVLERALRTVRQLVDGVNERQEEVYDPRQTMAYVYCAMAVFPCTLQLETKGKEVFYQSSSSGNLCLTQLEKLQFYCALKTEHEGTRGWQNLIAHHLMLLNLAALLEMERAPVTFLIANKAVPFLSILIGETRQIDYLPGMNGVSSSLTRLWDMAIVVSISSLIHSDCLQVAQVYRRFLSKVDTVTLPRGFAARYSYANARFLQNSRHFVKALDNARDALQGVVDLVEKRELEQLVRELTDAVESPIHLYGLRGPPDRQWLDGVPVVSVQERTRQQDEIRESHNSRNRKAKHKCVGVSKRGSTPSPAPSIRERSASVRSSSSHHLSVSSSSLASSSISNEDLPQASVLAVKSREDLPDFSDSDESDNEVDEEDVDKDICFVECYDDDENDDHIGYSMAASETTVMVAAEKMAENDNQQDWFERSEEMIANEEVADDQCEVIELSDEQIENFQKDDHGRIFYPALSENPEQLLERDPKKYKRCQLKIERSHRAIAKVLDEDSKYSEILIDGRSKAGRTYMDDEVVVEIIAEPGENYGSHAANAADSESVDEVVEKMAHGKVVGFLKRRNFADVKHPILYCTLDENEGHLMKPLCKTVPKIHVLNDKILKNYPALKKNRVEVKKISPEGKVQHAGLLNVQPGKREQYVFKVFIIGWRSSTIYPLGAVLKGYLSGKDYSSGLNVLSLQQRVPKYYPREAVENTNTLVQQTLLKEGREDLTQELQFTIDPPGSKDLDDAISIKKEGNQYIIGVHIADVTARVKLGSAVDQEARKRAVTFYTLDRQPRCMLPEPLSHKKCSLLPDKERLAISVFFRFDKLLNRIGDPVVKKTIIKSCQQLTYKEAQRIIDGVNTESSIREEIRNGICQIHKITSKLRDARKKGSVFFVPFEDPRLPELKTLKESVDAHSLIEELMILTNTYIAERLMKRPNLRDLMIVRCHKTPTREEIAEWQRSFKITDLVMKLQGQKVTPDTDLALENQPIGPRDQMNEACVVVQKEVWMKLVQHLMQGEVTEARNLAFMDSLHPLQCLAENEWMNMMEAAQYKCPHRLNRPELYHFGLGLDVYTHFTSPIRRYADMHIHRLVHADLDGKPPACRTEDVVKLCHTLNDAIKRQKAYEKGLQSLKVADSLQTQPMLFRAFVEKLDTEKLSLTLPSLMAIAERRQELSFSYLGVSHQPELSTDTSQKQDYVTVSWNKKVYDKTGNCPGSLRSMWRTTSLSASTVVLPNHKLKKIPPLTLFISPDQLTTLVKVRDWVAILKFLVSNKQRRWRHEPQDICRSLRSVVDGEDYQKYVEVDDMLLEKGDGLIVPRPVLFKRIYTKGQAVKVQLYAESNKGLLKPRVDILHITRNASVCLQHVRDPLTLCRFATRPTRGVQFSSYKEYVGCWMPLIEMEAAMELSNSDGCIVIENVDVTMKSQPSSDNDVLFRGTFKLGEKFCFDRCIDFGGTSVHDSREKGFKSDNSYPLDYLCLRYKMDCCDSIVSRIKQSEIAETVDKHFTWLAHAVIAEVQHVGPRGAEDLGQVLVTFVLTKSSPQPPPALMAKKDEKLTIEILPKSDVYRRAQKMLLALQDPEYELARSLAFGRSIPKLDSERKQLGKKDENHEIPSTARLPKNNVSQYEAIKMAMTNSLSIIQGPPGTGKTNTGVKLVYLFCKINRQLQENGLSKSTVLYCGPSNKSVDLVARQLKEKLGDNCPKMLRVYGSTIEGKDYPVPRSDLRSSRKTRDLCSDPALEGVTLHHLIRVNGEHANDICKFDKFFDMCIREPNKHSVTSKELKNYYKLVHKASLEELAKAEVILATCSVGGNRKVIEGTGKTIYQVIIDECAMSPEPLSMVPIIATCAKQVVLIGDHKQLRPIIKCEYAADLGLDLSLFERLFARYPTYKTFLNTQYRMHPEICAFPSQQFYNNKLRTAMSKLWYGIRKETEERDQNNPALMKPSGYLTIWPKHPTKVNEVVPHLLINVVGEEEMLTVTTEDGNERSRSNSLEADKVIEILSFLKAQCFLPTSSVMILTQYNAQRHLLERKLQALCEDRSQKVFDRYDKRKLNISTVVSSQGGEWDYVILSTVRSIPSYRIEPHPTIGWCRQNLGFINDKNQVNVALTRARRGIFIVGNISLLKCDSLWKKMVERYEDLGCCFHDPSKFPPPPPPRPRPRLHLRQTATDGEWQQVSRGLR